MPDSPLRRANVFQHISLLRRCFMPGKSPPCRILTLVAGNCKSFLFRAKRPRFPTETIDAGGCQCLDCERMYLYGRTDSGGTDCEWFVEWLQPALRHLAKAAVVGAKNQYFHRFLFIVTDAKIINAGLWWLYSKLILFIAWKIFSIYVRYCLLWQLVSCEKQVASFPDQWSCRISFTAAFALCVCTGWDAEELG